MSFLKKHLISSLIIIGSLFPLQALSDQELVQLLGHNISSSDTKVFSNGSPDEKVIRSHHYFINGYLSKTQTDDYWQRVFNRLKSKKELKFFLMGMETVNDASFCIVKTPYTITGKIISYHDFCY